MRRIVTLALVALTLSALSACESLTACCGGNRGIQPDSTSGVAASPEAAAPTN